MPDPAGLLAQLGVQSTQVVAPGYGYSGTFTPRAVMPHWTASAAGSDTAASVVAGRHYHACTSRTGVVALGGYLVRQGHGGEGRTSPQSMARAGVMTVAELDRWHDDPSSDDTSSGANQDFYGVCIDNDGVGERPGDAQWHAFTASVAVFLDLAGTAGPGSICDHAASTNRKIDLISMTASLYDGAATQLALLRGGIPAVAHTIPPGCVERHPSGKGNGFVRDDGLVYISNPAQGGQAHYYGSLGDNPPGSGKRTSSSTPVRFQWTESGKGYSIYTADGGEQTFGDAVFSGSVVDKIQT